MNNRPELKNLIMPSKGMKTQPFKKDYYSDFEPMAEYMQEDKRSDTWASSITVNVPGSGRKPVKSKEAKEDLSRQI